MQNELLEKFEREYGTNSMGPGWGYLPRLSNFQLRDELVLLYSWAVPNAQALDIVAGCDPIVEMGAGTGYWAALLKDMCVDIVAYDIDPPDETGRNEYKHLRTFTEVLEGSHEKLRRHSSRALFLCWPPYCSPMAAECLRAYRGDTLVYIGETWGGCNGDEDFWNLLRDEWQEMQYFRIPQFNGIHDGLYIYMRDAVIAKRKKAKNAAKRRRRAIRG